MGWASTLDAAPRAGRFFPRAYITTLLALCIVAASCGTADAVDDAHVDALPRLVVEPLERIGDFEDPEAGFSRVGGIDVDRDGNLFVVEASVPEIRVYDPDGGLVRRIGRRGSGPGEFEGPLRLGVVGDTVWTFDNAIRRLTLFERRGEVLSTARVEGLPVPLPEGRGYLLPWIMRDDGSFTSHFGLISFARDDPPTGVQPTDSIPVPLVLFDASGEVTDTIGWTGRPPPRMWRPADEASPPPEYLEVDGRRMMVPAPPSVLPRWEPLSDGYVLVETPLAESPDEGAIRVTRFGLAGDTIYHRVLRYRPVAYTDADLDSIAARAARREGGGGAPVGMGTGAREAPDDWPRIARRLRTSMDFPRFRPPLQSVWMADDETIWLRRDGEGSTARWIGIGPAGEPRGELELPASTRMAWNRGDTLWAVQRDEFDVPWVVRFAIEEGEDRE